MQSSKNSDVIVSVFMITYNHKNYIEKAIQGVLTQKTGFKVQLVVGDDHSTDGTADIVKKYSDKYPDRIDAILNEVNLGVQANAKNVYRKCTGKYMAMCEGDDFWHDPLKLEKQVEFMENHPDCGMVYTDYDLLYDKNNKIVRDRNKSKSLIAPQGMIFDEILDTRFPMIATSTVLMRNGIVDYIKMSDTITKNKWVLGDYAIWLEMSQKANISYLNESTSTYRLVENSASRLAQLEKHHIFHKSAFNIIFYYWKKYSGDEKLRHKLITEYNNVFLGDAFKSKNIYLAKIAKNNILKYNKKLNCKQIIKYILINLYSFCRDKSN